MTWNEIKKQLLDRHEHAIEFAADELRVVLEYRDGQRVPLVVRRHEDEVIVVAQVAGGSPMQVIAMLRAATSLGISLSMIGDAVCVRTVIATSDIESTLQATSRAALRIRRAIVRTATADINAFAFAL